MGVRFSIIIFNTCLLCLLLISCAPKYGTIENIRTSTCQPPCWYGIKPNVTQLDEVKEILKETSIIDPNSINWYGEQLNYTDQVEWRFLNSSQTGHIYFSNSTAKIFLFNNLQIKLSDLLQYYGTPDRILFSKPAVWADYGEIILSKIFYSQFGIVLFVKVEPKAKAVINATVKVLEIIYVNPNDQFQNLIPYFISKDEMMNRSYPWVGYGTYTTGN